MNRTWGAGASRPPERLHRELAVSRGREILGVKWGREVLVVPTRLLLIRGRRAKGATGAKFRPSVPGCFARARNER